MYLYFNRKNIFCKKNYILFSNVRGLAKILWQVCVIDSFPYTCQNDFITDFKHFKAFLISVRREADGGGRYGKDLIGWLEKQ